MTTFHPARGMRLYIRKGSFVVYSILTDVPYTTIIESPSTGKELFNTETITMTSAAQDPNRNSDGTFKPRNQVGSGADTTSTSSTSSPSGGQSASGASDRKPDGTFKSGNKAASTIADEVPIDTHSSAGNPASVDPSRNLDGTFKAGSSATNPDNFANKPKGEVKELAKEGGKHSHDNDGK
jgi:hypothetical protein